MVDTLQMIGPEEYLAIVKRRKWHIVVPAAFLFCVVAVVAIVWPPTYQSSATILVEVHWSGTAC